jgi:hypothetical protein
VKPCNQNIRKTLELAEKMIALADQGDRDREDVGCGILYGMLRDSAYKLKQLAEKEREAHIRKGWWVDKCHPP